ncbi:hypothetical protein MHYP_G00075890 [Metynnis hypsauchen]
MALSDYISLSVEAAEEGAEIRLAAHPALPETGSSPGQQELESTLASICGILLFSHSFDSSHFSLVVSVWDTKL